MNRREMIAASTVAAATFSLGLGVADAAEFDLVGLPPGVSRDAFQTALARFRAVVGDAWLFTAKADLDLYRDAYSPYRGEAQDRVCSAAVAPDGVEQVRAIARIANELKIPLYPISTGRDLGYGGSAPVLSGSVVLDLKRMNRVLSVDEDHAYAVVEPGVSYMDLYKHIRDSGLRFWVDCPAPGWGGPIGNALDRGVGSTRVDFRNHFESHCGMEVVLANGDLVRTGMGALPKSETWQQYKAGYGPSLDALFCQSNYGIVTKMGFWLMPEPEAYRAGEVLIEGYEDLIPFMRVLNRLENQRIFNGMPGLTSPLFGSPERPIRPSAELMALLQGPQGPDAAGLRAAARRLGTAMWSCRLRFYGPEAVTAAQWQYAKRELASLPGVRFVDDVEHFHFPLSDEQINKLMDPAYFGIPSLDQFDVGLEFAASKDPVIGHIFFTPIIPRTGEAALKANEVLGKAARDLGVPMPPLTIPAFMWERSLIIIIGFPITANADTNRKMREAFLALVKLAAQHGWAEYRTAPAFYDAIMDTYSFNEHAHRRLCETLKDAIDPNGILSAGRYGIWPAHLRTRRPI
jgi:(+)-pinoresinol hydroxylase